MKELESRLGWALLAFLWQGTLVAALAAAGGALLRHRKAAARYTLFCGAMLLMLALPVATFFTHRAAEVVAGSESAFGPAAPAAGTAASPSVAPARRGRDGGAPSVAGVAGIIRRSAAPVMPWMVAGWLSGVVLLSLRFLTGWASARQLRHRGVTPAPVVLEAALARLSRRMRIWRPVQLLQSAAVAVPTALGALKPVILLPLCAVTGLGAEEIEAVLAHELAHIRRHDYLVNLLQTAAETLLFYHPAVWWISRRIRIERENCCDDLAVMAMGDACIYARALVDLEEIRGPRPRLAVAATGATLSRRIARLLPGFQAPAERASRWLGGALALAMLGTLGAAARFSAEREQVAEGVANGVAGGILGGVSGGVSGGIAGGVSGGVSGGVAPVLGSAGQGDDRQQSVEGRWILDFDRSEGRVQLTMKRRTSNGSWTNSSTYSVQDFRGLSRPAGAAQAPARFDIVRDAGTFHFEGRLDESGGAGSFAFAANPEFERAWRAMGYGPLADDQAYSFTVHDIGLKFLEDLRSLGYERVPADQLVAMRIHGASPEVIRELQALGYERLPVDQLVAMRIHGATPEFVRELKALGYERVPAEELVAMRIHGARPDYVRELKSLGYERIPVQELVAMRIHGASIEFVRELQSLGYSRVPAEDLVAMRIHGVSPEYIRGLQTLGYRQVPVQTLVAMRIHGVTVDFARKARERDPGVSPDELVNLRIHGR